MFSYNAATQIILFHIVRTNGLACRCQCAVRVWCVSRSFIVVVVDRNSFYFMAIWHGWRIMVFEPWNYIFLHSDEMQSIFGLYPRHCQHHKKKTKRERNKASLQLFSTPRIWCELYHLLSDCHIRRSSEGQRSTMNNRVQLYISTSYAFSDDFSGLRLRKIVTFLFMVGSGG